MLHIVPEAEALSVVRTVLAVELVEEFVLEVGMPLVLRSELEAGL